MACATPAGVSKCLATPVYNIGGTDYVTLELCDNNGRLLAVYEICNGVLSGAPAYYDLAGSAYTPVGTPRNCEASGDFEQFVFCDTATDPPTPFISRALWTENGDLVVDQTGTYALDGITPYTPAGPVTVCGGDVIDVEFVGPLCEKDASGNTIGYVWHKIFHRGQTRIATALAGYKLAAPNTWADPYTLAVGNTLVACDSKTPQLVTLCDIYPKTISDNFSAIPAGLAGSDTDFGGSGLTVGLKSSVAFSYIGTVVFTNVTNTFAITLPPGKTNILLTLTRMQVGETVNNFSPQPTALISGAGYTLAAGVLSSSVPAGIVDAVLQFPDDTTTIQFTYNVDPLTLGFGIAALSWQQPETKQFIRHYCMDCATGTTRDTELDGVTAYTVQGTVGICQDTQTIEIVCACDDADGDGVAIATILVCGVVGGVSKPLIRREMVDSAGTETVTFFDTDDVEVTPTTWTPGQCENHLTSTIERLTGAGSITIPANARSITVAVNAGNPTVQIGSGAAIPLVKNLAFTWGTNDRNEDLADAFVFTGITGDDFYVTTSRL